MAGRKYQMRWVGGPGQFIAGVPADDHEVEGAEARDELVASGLYEWADAPADDNEEADSAADDDTEEG